MRSFLQSPEWQEIQEQNGHPSFWVPGEEGRATLIIKHDLFRGRHYLYCPHPETAGVSLCQEVRGLASGEGSLFLKIDPLASTVFPPGSRISHSLQPRKTAIVSLQRPDNGMFSRMRQKTRYNIRLGLRHGVSARPVSFPSEGRCVEEFFDVLAETAARDHFSLHPRDHYLRLLEVSSGDFANELWIAEKNGRMMAGAIVNRYAPSGTGTYLHGASRTNGRNCMAPYALHWEIMRSLRDRGLDIYDWGGVDEQRWPGLTRFKMGFGGEVIERPRSVDIAFRPWSYLAYRSLRGIRNFRPWKSFYAH